VQPRILIQNILRLSIIFSLMIALIRLQPYQDGGLRALLTPPPDCASPCWLGVRPGTMTIHDGNTILRQNPSVKTFESVSPATMRLRFAADELTAQGARLNMWGDAEGFVNRLEVFIADLSFSDVLLALGNPTRLVIYETLRYGTSELTAVYPEFSLYVTTAVALCSVNQNTFWIDANDVTIHVGAWQGEDSAYSQYVPAAVELDSRQWAAQLRALRSCP
jgi:hypothetical protein